MTKENKGSLFVVATPIGNLEDITLRALRVLKEVDLVAAEDTRVSRKLFSRYSIQTPLTSYHEHNEKEKTPYLVEKLKEGSSIAVISDAGTPGISDPGYRFIKACIEEGIPVIPIPGPSALITALTVSGLPLDEFAFKGFVPQGKNERRRFFLELKGTRMTYLMFEAARRLPLTLPAVKEVLGDVDMVMAREMTKVHEEVFRGKVTELIEAIKGKDLLGEISIVLRTQKEEPLPGEVEKEIEKLLRSGLPLKDVAKALARESGLPRGEVYKLALGIKEKLGL